MIRPPLHAQLRHLSAPQLIVDTVMTAAVATLALLALLLAGSTTFDTLAFEAGLRYETREERASPTGQGLEITVHDGIAIEGAAAVDARRGDDPFRAPVFPATWTWDAGEVEDVHSLLGRNVSAGTVGTDVVLIDESSAHALGVGIGDALVLTADGGGFEETACRATVGGVTRTYQESGFGARGLLVLPETLCPDVVALSRATRTLGFDTGIASADTWADRMSEELTAASRVDASGAVLPILAIGVALWLLVTLRMARRVRGQLARADAVLGDLGVRPSDVTRTHLVAQIAVTAVVSCLAAWSARQTLLLLHAPYIQPLQAVLAAAAFTLVSVIAAVVLDRRRRRTSSTPAASPSPPSTSPGNEPL